MTGPNLFLIAAPRSGSTQLARWLASHPDIGVSPIKEPNHFSAHEFDPDYVFRTHLNDCDPDRLPRRPVQFAVVRDPHRYAALFAGLTEPWRMDASTSYLSCPEAPANIWRHAPTARIILLTRDPVERALSHYRLALRTGRTTASLGEELGLELSGTLPLAARYLVRPSLQQEGVLRFRATFPAAHVISLSFEDMVMSPLTAVSRAASLLGIDPDGFDLGIAARNEGAQPRFATINRFLHQSGAKTRIRRFLPAALKPGLRRLWFDASAKPYVSGEDLVSLRYAVGAPT